jgi:1-acyl-sn-glycerol-3-phosphate acyltransferase
MGCAFYTLTKAAFVVPRLVAIREVVLDAQRADRSGPFILAVSHLSHTEPIFVSSHVRRHVRWMARVEHYHSFLGRRFLEACGAFSVDRFGNAGPAVRSAIRLLRAGGVVGVFPEGGNADGPASVLRGGPIKGGAATISIATGAPVVPVVVLGTHALNRVRPWLPVKSGRVWIAFGEEVQPPERSPGDSRRALRLRVTAALATGFIRTFQSLLEQEHLLDSSFP